MAKENIPTNYTTTYIKMPEDRLITGLLAINVRHITADPNTDDTEDDYYSLEIDESDPSDEQQVHVDNEPATSVVNESFVSNYDTYVNLENIAILSNGSLVVDDNGTPVPNFFSEGSDFEIDYGGGRIKVLSTGTMSDATTYYIDYEYIDETRTITDEIFTADYSVAIQLNHTNLVSGSETVTTTSGGGSYTNGTNPPDDYTMDYVNGTITVIPGGDMSDNTEYYIDYTYEVDRTGLNFNIADYTCFLYYVSIAGHIGNYSFADPDSTPCSGDEYAAHDGCQHWVRAYQLTGVNPNDTLLSWNGNRDRLTSGLLEVGKSYQIFDFQAGDDFTNVGASSNNSGVVFVASGTTPTTWSNSSVLVEEDSLAVPMELNNYGYVCVGGNSWMSSGDLMKMIPKSGEESIHPELAPENTFHRPVNFADENESPGDFAFNPRIRGHHPLTVGCTGGSTNTVIHTPFQLAIDVPEHPDAWYDTNIQVGFHQLVGETFDLQISNTEFTGNAEAQ